MKMRTVVLIQVPSEQCAGYPSIRWHPWMFPTGGRSWQVHPSVLSWCVNVWWVLGSVLRRLAQHRPKGWASRLLRGTGRKRHRSLGSVWTWTILRICDGQYVSKRDEVFALNYRTLTQHSHIGECKDSQVPVSKLILLLLLQVLELHFFKVLTSTALLHFSLFWMHFVQFLNFNNFKSLVIQI
jgi:hypothetical protein